LSACANLWGTVCPRVQIDEVLFVRVCKNDGVLFVRGTICPEPYLKTAAPKRQLAKILGPRAKMTGYYLSGVLFVRDSFKYASSLFYYQDTEIRISPRSRVIKIPMV